MPGRWAALLDSGVIYEDESLLAINKPSGLAVHGGSGLSLGMIECLRKLRPRTAYLELVHRLDRDTSGCILVAKKPAVLRELHRQLREDTVDKRYLALVAGRWSAKRRFVEAPLRKNTLQSGERVVRVDRGGKPSRTEFAVVERFARATLIEAKPVTGRTHQIRVHALQAGHPILGDQKYGEKEANLWAAERGLRRLFLHAANLRVKLPDGGVVELVAPLAPELEAFLQKLRDG